MAGSVIAGNDSVHFNNEVVSMLDHHIDSVLKYGLFIQLIKVHQWNST